MWLKICGITDEDDARLAAALGVDAVGFVFWPGSRRFVAPLRAASIAASLPPRVERVGVFVHQGAGVIEEVAREVGLDTIQVHGPLRAAQGSRLGPLASGAGRLAELTSSGRDWADGAAPRLIAALPVGPDFDVAAVDRVHPDVTILLDAAEGGAPGGTGRTIDWSVAARVACRRRTVLAGGLTPGNVGQAIRTVRPYGVDVASGVEYPGRPGVKDPDRLKRFVTAVKMAEVMER